MIKLQIEKLNLDWRQPLQPIRRKITKIVLHHPAHMSWGAEEIHDYHKNKRGWSGAGYNYFVTKDGQVQELRGNHVGAHVKGFNDVSLGVCFQGNFDFEEMDITQILAGAWLIYKLIQDNGLSLTDVIGHKDLAPTNCPGKNFPLSAIKQRVLEHINPKNIKTDDIFGHWAEPSIRKAIKKGIVKGYKDGTIRPDEPLTLARLMVIIDRLNLLN